MTFRILALDVWQPNQDAGALLTSLTAAEAIDRAHQLDRSGNTDQVIPAAVRLRDLAPSSDREEVFLLAVQPAPAADGERYGFPLLRATDPLEAGQVLGFATLRLPLLDNLGTVQEVSIAVAEPHRRRGVGRALSQAVDELARRAGRAVLQGWSDTDASDAPDALRPPDGGFLIGRDAGTEFAQAMGYQLAQAERHSVLDLQGRTFVPPPTPGYQIATWRGATPERYLPGVAAMLAAMSDAPTAGLAWEDEVWDAARVRETESRVLQTRDGIISLVIAEATGEAAALTQLYRMDATPTVVEQWNTVVVGPHRGHGLGLAIKLANLAAVRRWWPDAQRVHTWNAAENDHMWRINDRLGFRTVNIDSGWQKRL